MPQETIRVARAATAERKTPGAGCGINSRQVMDRSLLHIVAARCDHWSRCGRLSVRIPARRGNGRAAGPSQHPAHGPIIPSCRRAGSRTSGADRIAPRRRTASPVVGETSPRCYADPDRKSHKPRRPNRCGVTPVHRSRHSEISSHGSLRFFRDFLRYIMVKLRSRTYSACDLTRQPEDPRVPVV
jgi:hypothetical protein